MCSFVSSAAWSWLYLLALHWQTSQSTHVKSTWFTCVAYTKSQYWSLLIHSGLLNFSWQQFRAEISKGGLAYSRHHYKKWNKTIQKQMKRILHRSHKTKLNQINFSTCFGWLARNSCQLYKFTVNSLSQKL